MARTGWRNRKHNFMGGSVNVLKMLDVPHFEPAISLAYQLRATFGTRKQGHGTGYSPRYSPKQLTPSRDMEREVESWWKRKEASLRKHGRIYNDGNGGIMRVGPKREIRTDRIMKLFPGVPEIEAEHLARQINRPVEFENMA